MNLLLASARHLALAFALLAAGHAGAQVAVSPQMLDLDVEQAAATNAFRIYNETSETKRVRVSLASWDKDESNRVRDVQPTALGLERWTVVSPLDFELAPGKSQAVRFSLRPPVELAPGEHRLMLYFNEETPIPAGQAATTLNVRFRIGAAIYVHAGAVERRGEFHSATAVPGALMFDLTTTGNATTRLVGQYVVYPAHAFPGTGKVPRVERVAAADAQRPEGAVAVGALPGTSVLPQARRNVPLDLAAHDLAAGRYVVAVDGHFGDTPVSAAVDYVVPAK
jgi:P pilus assembly chaperone PapD